MPIASGYLDPQAPVRELLPEVAWLQPTPNLGDATRPAAGHAHQRPAGVAAAVHARTRPSDAAGARAAHAAGAIAGTHRLQRPGLHHARPHPGARCPAAIGGPGARAVWPDSDWRSNRLLATSRCAARADRTSVRGADDCCAAKSTTKTRSRWVASPATPDCSARLRGVCGYARALLRGRLHSRGGARVFESEHARDRRPDGPPRLRLGLVSPAGAAAT